MLIFGTVRVLGTDYKLWRRGMAKAKITSSREYETVSEVIQGRLEGTCLGIKVGDNFEVTIKGKVKCIDESFYRDETLLTIEVDHGQD